MEDYVFQIISAVLALLLAVSEYLPFSKCEYNGLTQAATFSFKKANAQGSIDGQA